MVRDKLPFNGVESKNHFGVTEKNAIYFDVLCQRNKVVLSDAVSQFHMDCLACIFDFQFLARTANKAFRISVALSFNVFMVCKV